MGTYYIDPSALVNGDGSENSPFNTWASVTFASGNQYLQKQGTIYAGAVTVNAAGADEDSRIILAVYGPQVIPLASGLAQQKAKINGAGTSRTLIVSAGSHFVTINNFEIYGTDNAAVSIRGVLVGSSAAAKANNVTMQNCIVHDISSGAALVDENAVQVYGDNFRFLSGEIYNSADDGLWVEGSYLEVGNSHIHDIAQSNRVAGDCIQISNATGVSSHYWIYDSILDHANVEMKQCFIDAGGFGGSTGGIFERNTCIMGTDNFSPDVSKTINIGNPGALVRQNILRYGWTTTWLAASNISFTDNLIFGCKRCGVNLSGSTSGSLLCGNTIISHRLDKIASSRAIEVSSTTVGAKVYNNAAKGVGLDYMLVCSKTAATSNGIDFKSNKGLANTALASVNGGVDASNVSVDPLVDDDGVLLTGSPCFFGLTKYWANGPRPTSINGEARPDDGGDIGCYQSRLHPYHPANLKGV